MKFKTGNKVILKRSFDKDMAAKDGATATVRGYSGSYVQIEWDRNNPLVYGQSDGGYIEGDFVLMASTIVKLKPIQTEAEVKGGEWRYVVLNGDGNAVAMFVDEDHATAFRYDYDEDWTVREVAG